jgi:Ca-activated chloride channel family protein
MNVDFNPDYVKEYRLIGFDNKVGALRDSLSVIEGGEIGSGYSMMALFEIVPAEANKNMVNKSIPGEKFADIKLQYQYPNDEKECHFGYVSRFELKPLKELDSCYRFSASVAMFGSLLRGSSFIKNSSWSDVISLAQSASGNQDLLQKEFIALVQQAKTLYSKVKKKKGGGSTF